jgi:hypothetical protein
MHPSLLTFEKGGVDMNVHEAEPINPTCLCTEHLWRTHHYFYTFWNIIQLLKKVGTVRRNIKTSESAICDISANGVG